MTITSTTTSADADSSDARTRRGDHRIAGDLSLPVTNTDDRYFATLRTLSARAMTARATMLDAHLAATPQERTAALVNLHHHLRGMAGIVNDALGAMDKPQEPR